jgi:hypothetical protein
LDTKTKDNIQIPEKEIGGTVPMSIIYFLDEMIMQL